jgi:hypothetical protein
MALTGNMLKIFPQQGSANNKWISFDDIAAKEPLSGVVTVMNQDLKLDPLNYNNFMLAYLKSVSTGDYPRADKMLSYITSLQRNSDNGGYLASDRKINVEILYNKLRFSSSGMSIQYLVLCYCFWLIDNLYIKKNKFITWSLNISIVALGLAFLYHTFGMIMRWYLTGHAPWSNGYESLILIAWGGLLAGFSFARYSKITLAATALLAFFTLMTASHSSYDPQLTNDASFKILLVIYVATLL